jgi:poly-gamma-glutamate synthesis protein (capsule biosynthesis protein)
MKILFFSDLVPTENNYHLFKGDSFATIFSDELFSLMKETSLNVINLECPLYDGEQRIDKCGPTLVAPRECINALSSIPHPLFLLANNHIFDCGEEGLTSTISSLDEKRIPHIGAGRDRAEASKPYHFGDDVILNICEHEFSVSETGATANAFIEHEIYSAISSFKNEGKKVIVIYHGGREYYPYPTPRLYERCHKMIDCGAALVLVEHIHIVGEMERYHQGTIVYGLGNFVFNLDVKGDSWKRGIAVEYDDVTAETLIIPTIQDHEIVRLAKGAELKEIIDGFNARSEQIKDSSLIIANYQKERESALIKFLCKLGGYSRLRMGIEVVIFKGFFVKRRYSKKKLLCILNILECESHNEILVSGIKDLIANK